tara:strand:- start:1926 stop:3353 length:1428 start_codon:yes stop_codon:yes gene_type:complete
MGGRSSKPVANKLATSAPPPPPPPPLPRHSVSIGNWTSYVKNHTNNYKTRPWAWFLVGWHGGGRYDPARGCRKSFNATYKCGYGPTKSANVRPEAWGRWAVFNCWNERINCLSYRLTLTDTGNIVLTQRGRLIWQSNTYDTGIPVSKYKARNSKYRRNFIVPGEYLEEGEFIGSPSGNCYILMTRDGLKLCYEITDCKINKELLGYGLSNNAYTLYHIPLADETNIEKTGYLSYGGTLTEKFTTNSNKKAPYLEIGNYNSTDDSLTINKFNNFTTYTCKDKCDDNKNCGGFYISNRKVCELKNDNIKQNIYRKENTDGLLYIKSNPPNENSKYNNKITDTTGVQWDKYNLDNDSDIKKLTELGMITKEEIGDLLRARNQLAQSNNKFKDSINKLAIEDAEISLETKEDIKNFRNNLKDYKTFDKKSNEIKSKLNNLDAMKLDSELQLIQDNKQYLMWTIATILVVIGSMKIVKQN